jgi:hypothetical protein
VSPALADAFGAMAGVVESRSRYGDRVAWLVDGREVAHLDADGTLDVRLTRAVIRTRPELRGSRRRDWVSVDPADETYAMELFRQAVEAHLPRGYPGTR